MRMLLAAVLVLLVATPAHAQGGGAIVARNGDVTLRVKDARDGICLDLHDGDSAIAGTCGEPPAGRMSALVTANQVGTRSFTTGAVAAGATAVELEFARGERVRARTVAGTAYTGRSKGRLAYFLAETTGSQRFDDDGEDDPVLIRMFDAGGTLIGAASGGGEGSRVGEPRTLLRERGLTVAATATRTFAPSVIELDRTETSVCLDVRRPNGRSGGPCTGPGPALPLLALVPQRECSRGLLVHGFVSPRVTSVELTLGDGRRKRADTLDVGSLGTVARAVAIVVPPGLAIRSARGLDAAGREVDTQEIAAAPAARRCGIGISSFLAFGFGAEASPEAGATGEVAAGTAPGPRLLARDDGDQLCLGIDGFAAQDHVCLVPAPATDFPQMIDRETASYTAAAGLVPDGAAAVHVVFDGGDTIAATISDGGAYSGRYRGHVRFFLAAAERGRTVEALETYDARGRLLAAIPGPNPPGAHPTTFARRGGYRLFGARFDYRFKFPGRRAQRSRGTCVGIAFGGRRPDPYDCQFVDGGVPAGTVSCSPRLGVLMGRIGRRARGARLSLAGGGTIRSRTVAVPRRLGGGRLWVLEIPPGARATRLRMLGGRTRPYPLPAPRRQCGYALDVTF